jgi:hypothetical protein
MYCVSDQQMDFILGDLRSLGIVTESLQQNLLDHICIIIEQGLEENGDFHQFYASTVKTFYKKSLGELEEEALFLLSYKRPLLVLGRTAFFILLFSIFIGPFAGYDIYWLVRSGWQIPFHVWGATLTYSLFPLLTLLVLLLTPDKLDPVLPKNCKILLGGSPWISILPQFSDPDVQNNFRRALPASGTASRH